MFYHWTNENPTDNFEYWKVDNKKEIKISDIKKISVLYFWRQGKAILYRLRSIRCTSTIYRDRCTLGLFYLLLVPYPEGGIEVNRTPKWITQYLANISPYVLRLMPYALCLMPYALPVAIIPFFFLILLSKTVFIGGCLPCFFPQPIVVLYRNSLSEFF